jgi:release factor glutamine methyltransferase
MIGHRTKVAFMFLCFMKTVKDAYLEFKHRLTELYEANEADAIASMVLSDLTGYSKGKLKAFTDTILTNEQLKRLEDILAELVTGKPVQYILGYTEFYGLTFYVDQSVLIPRPETEELVQWVLQTITGSSHFNILDIGTGSGCIPIAIKHNYLDSKLFAVDISTGAIGIAAKNAEQNNTEVTFIEADILNPRSSKIYNYMYNVIISNPPYVTETDKQQMHENVTGFEPHTALFVPNHSPLMFYEAIASFATDRLNNSGYLFFEINESFGVQTVNMLADKGFSNIELRPDMAGKDRMIRAVWLN